MTVKLRIVHTHGDRITLTEPTTGVELFAYVYAPEAAWEAPKPYLHPMRTLAGDIVTDYRPNDHRWHKGLQLTASHLSGQTCGAATPMSTERGISPCRSWSARWRTPASTRSPRTTAVRSSPNGSPGTRTAVRCGRRRSAASRSTTSTRPPGPGR